MCGDRRFPRARRADEQCGRPPGAPTAQQRIDLVIYKRGDFDPIRFEQDLRVTIQALGWRSGGRYLPLQDDIASVAYWSQAEPHAAFGNRAQFLAGALAIRLVALRRVHRVR